MNSILNSGAFLVPFVITVGLFGLIIGSFLNVVIYRVPAGISLLRESRCPTCTEPVRWYQNVPVLSWLLLRGRCGSCRQPISARYPLVELATGIAFAAIAWGWIALGADAAPGAQTPLASFEATFGAIAAADGTAGPLAGRALVLVAFLWFAATGIALTLIDLDTQRLPHAITTPSIVVTILLLSGASILGVDAWALVRAGIGFVALYVFYGILRIVRPDGMGGGDVRLAAYTGLVLGWLGWGPLIVGAFAAFVAGGLYGIALLFSQRAGRKSGIPFGPWIIAGAWIGIVAGEPLADWYISLLTARSPA